MPANAVGPRSANALAILSTWLDRFDASTSTKGRALFKQKNVSNLAVAGPEVHARVSDDFNYDTRLTWSTEEWTATCTCPVGENCKHIFASGLAWLRTHDNLQPLPIFTQSSPRIPPRERALADAFAAATGSAPSSQELSFLRNLDAIHVSLQPSQHRNQNWFDIHALSNLAPASLRHLITHHGHTNPFRDWLASPPPTPLQLWPYIALLFTELHIPLPPFTAPFDNLDLARKTRDIHRRTLLIKTWQQRFTYLEHVTSQTLSSSPSQSLRLRLSARKIAWEISHNRLTEPFTLLPSTELRELIQNPLHCAQVMDESSNTLLNYLRTHYQTRGRSTLTLADTEDRVLLCHLLNHPLASSHIVAQDGTPIALDPRPLTWRIDDHPSDPALALIQLALADGSLPPAPLIYLPGKPASYLSNNRTLFHGLPPITESKDGLIQPGATELPRAALELPEAGRFTTRAGIRLPGALANRFRPEPIHPRLRARLATRRDNPSNEILVLELHALAPSGSARARFQPDGWSTQAPGLQRSPDAEFLLHDFAPLQPIADHLGRMPGLRWDAWDVDGGRYSADISAPSFPEHFSNWLASIPAGTVVELSPDLTSFSEAPTQGHFTLEISESSEIDWFDVRATLKVEDTSLTAEEIALLRQASGRFIRLKGKGWRRLNITTLAEDQAHFTRLGLDPAALAQSTRETPRLHALQLADEALGDTLPDKLWNQIRDRASSLRTITAPELPPGLLATLRPYQLEGFHFLAHLSSNRFGGVLADDMGLGKTLQTLAWLLWLSARATAEGRSLRALVICPKSVVFNWQLEAERFAPSLTFGRISPRAHTAVPPDVQVIVANYTQLRLHSATLNTERWDAVILDEGQNIKNPTSTTAQAARSLHAAHRLILTGTPIENRLLDLWSLFAFAQPGLLGGQTAFKRLYDDRDNPATAHALLATRVRHFLLRRTKSQVAQDLPPRIEEDIVVELEGSQRKLYEAELKRTRQMLLGVQSNRDFDSQRFNILQSLLRLRQICCDPRLLTSAAEETHSKGKPGADAPEYSAHHPASAKLEALIDTLEPLIEEGHRVLVFSQFVTMLELIKAELLSRDIKHLLLTGQTEDRQTLVNQFQAPDGPPVFLLSLKAAGSGLNLTAASYVVLYDPWWNPAVEAQAIDRTHRIGQTNRVIAYRLLARGTVEEKIRALQKEKAALAASVVQEESLSSVLDLASLRQILS